MTLKTFFRRLGPGFITGASDDDPSGIATYSQAGARFGLTTLWTAFFSFPFMAIVQEMSGRIGLVTGRGLASVIKKYFPGYILFAAVFLLIVVNTITIGADLGAMASSINLILPLPVWFWLAVFAVGIVCLEIFIAYKTYAKFLKYLCLSLFAYAITAFAVTSDWGLVIASALKPALEFNSEYFFVLAAILGTTISPYLFFWQADAEVEEEVRKHKLTQMGSGQPKLLPGDIPKMRTDTIFGMFFSNLIMFFIILTAALTLHAAGLTDIQTAADAAEALRPIAGEFASLIFALGIVGTGLLAIPVLAGSAAYAIAETFDFKEGLSRKFSKAKAFYSIIIFSTLIGLVINFLPIPTFKMLYYAAALNGILAPPLLILLVLIAGSRKIMGENKNSTLQNLAGWFTVAMMAAVAVAVIATI